MPVSRSAGSTHLERQLNSDNATIATEDPNDLVIEVWRRKFVVAAVVAIAVLAAVIYLHRADYRYTAELHVIPSQAMANGASSRTDRLGGLASLVGLGTETATTSPFKLYLEEVTSRDIATELAKRPDIMHVVFDSEWDAQARRWVKPPATISAFKDGLKAILGFPPTAWRAPDGARLQEVLKSEIKVDSDSKRTVTVIRFDHRDPAFAVHMLEVLNATVDRHLRNVALARSTEYAAFLDRKLQTITIAEHRVAITEALSEQEKQIMLASSSAPYAADPIEAPTASLFPTSPRAPIVLFASVVIGLILGVLGVLTAIYVTQRRRSRLSIISAPDLGPPLPLRE